MTVSDLLKIAPNLELKDDGWWASRSLSEVSYPEEGNSVCFGVEDSSFWFQHRNRCILEAVKQFPPTGTIFDIGGGNGCVARAIQDSGRSVVLVEPGLVGVQNAFKRNIGHIVRGTLDDIGARAETIPAIGLFDVVEHIEDDSGFMAKIDLLLVSGGRVYITVPAYRWLWSREDILAGHKRRYTLHSLNKLLENAGLAVEFSTYFFGFLPLPIFLRRVLPYRLGFGSKTVSAEAVQLDHQSESPQVAQVLAKLTRGELARIANKRVVRWGGSCLAVARKRS